jgi:hypothetical protein
MTRPGGRIRSIASRLFGSETMERVIDPIVADLQCEYGEALVRGPLWRARLSLVRSYLGLGSSLIWLGMRYVCDPRIGNPGSEVARAWIVSVLALAILTVALVLPPLLTWDWWRRDPVFGALVSVTLVPHALPLSIPAGLCVGMLWATRGKVVTWRRLCAVLAIAIAFTAVVWVVLEWMMPLANQGFREMVATRLAVDGRVPRLEPGLNELGLSRLGQRSDPVAVRHYHVLWALCFAAIPLSLLAVGLAGYVRRAASAVALAIGLSILYIACIWVLATIPSGPPLPAFVQAWMPNMAFLLVACALLVRGQRRRARSAR